MATEAQKIVDEILSVRDTLSEFRKPNVQGGGGLTGIDYINYRMSLLKEIDMLTKQLRDMGYRPDASGQAVPVSRTIVDHARATHGAP